MTATKTFPIFDCDSHIVEPPEIWDMYIDPVLVVTERIADHHPAILAW
jgi:hypothetical protein